MIHNNIIIIGDDESCKIFDGNIKKKKLEAKYKLIGKRFNIVKALK